MKWLAVLYRVVSFSNNLSIESRLCHLHYTQYLLNRIFRARKH